MCITLKVHVCGETMRVFSRRVAKARWPVLLVPLTMQPAILVFAANRQTMASPQQLKGEYKKGVRILWSLRPCKTQVPEVNQIEYNSFWIRTSHFTLHIMQHSCHSIYNFSIMSSNGTLASTLLECKKHFTILILLPKQHSLRYSNLQIVLI